MKINQAIRIEATRILASILEMYPAQPTVTTVYLLTSFIDNNHRYRAKMSHAANIKLSCSKEFYAQRQNTRRNA